jgi:hypothetical protein
MEKILNPKTKQAQAFIKAYQGATMTKLKEAYNRPSWAKIEAYEKCKNLMREMNGYQMKITGYNCDAFSCGCIAYHKGQKGLLYFTAYNTYFIPSEN